MAPRAFHCVRRHAANDAFQPGGDRERGSTQPAKFRGHAILHPCREAIHAGREPEFRCELGLGGEVEEAGEALFAGERMDAEEESLQTGEIGFSFDAGESGLSAGAGVVPALRDCGSVRGGIAAA